MTLNISSRILFQLYQIFDFIFLVSYPLEHIYHHSKAAKQTPESNVKNAFISIFSYMNPADTLFKFLDYSTKQQVNLILIIYSFILISVLMALIFFRNKKKLSTSNHLKLINKVMGLVISLTNFFFFVPLLSIMTKTFTCDQEESSCYSGSHLALLCFSVVAIIVQIFISFYSHSMMTSCYPNETIPWSHFPSKVPYVKVIFRLAVILVYQIDQNKVLLLYFNAFFTLCLIGFVYQRIAFSMTFDRSIHTIDLLSEAILLDAFFISFLCDLLNTFIDGLFTMCLFVSIFAMMYLAYQLKSISREKFLKKIDIFNYKYEFDALHMMIALHELIEMSSFDEKEEFILRGFIERHIEICDLPECNCIEYYKIINSSYRIQLATIATMKEDENNKSSMQNTYNQKATYDDDNSEDTSMQKTFFVQNTNIVRQNKARTKFMNNFLINNINVFLELFPNSVKLRYMSAFIYFNLFKNSFKALYELSYTHTIKSSFGDTYDSYTLCLKIIDYFLSRVNSFLSRENKILDLEIDLKQIIEFEKLNIKYQKSIEQTSEIAESFWLELNKKNINIESIFYLGSSINNQFYQIKKKYKKLMSINSNYLEVAYLYKLFVSLCLNYELEETEAKMEITKILQAKGMRKKNLRQEYCRINFSDENGMIIISGCQKDFSKILAMNNKAERIFGYNTSELINHSLTKLQPLVYGYSHDDFILNYVNSKRKINKDQHSFVWGKHKSGFIMPLVMDISPYVTFEYNLCFIAFTKRSILLEMNPLKEILDAQDVFVLLADQKGIITDMTRNITEWLGFPLQALNKDISLEQIFDGILDDETDKDFLDGKRIDFFMNSFKDALDDYENRSEDEFESTLCMKEKKCRALVWMKIHEHSLAGHATFQPANNPGMAGSGIIGTIGGSMMTTNHPSNQLVVREIWFVLLEEEAATATATASFLDTKNTHESGIDKEELKFTYQEDREEICSLASVSSLAGYGSSDKGLINKLSEIKTSTVEESKPKSITLLQKVLVLVFILSVSSAVITLIFTMIRDQSFYFQIGQINSAKVSSIHFANLQIITRELVNIANNDQDNNSSFIQGTLSQYLQDEILIESELFRNLQKNLDNINENAVLENSNTSEFKKQNLSLKYLRKDCHKYEQIKSYAIVFYEILTITQEIGQVKDIDSMRLTRNTLKSLELNNFKQCDLTEFQRSIYFILENNISPELNFYPFKLTKLYIDSTLQTVEDNKILFLVITIIAIAITFLTSILIIPIILRIESNKEKVFFIYAELSKNDIDDRKRNIRIFFAKLRQSTNNPGGSLFYQKSSRIVSSRLLTKKFSLKEEGTPMGNFGLTRQGQVKDGTGQNTGDKNQVDMEEDIRAELMKQQEELEAAVFKKFFHRKIKQMSCLKKFKYILLILFFGGLVQGYFVLIHQLISQMDTAIYESLSYYEIISSRNPLFSELIGFYRESLARNQTVLINPNQLDDNENTTSVSSVDYFVQRTLENEKKYNQLRKSVPSILQSSSYLIEKLEGEDLCKQNLTESEQNICETALNGLLKTGMTQTINTMVKDIIQSQIDFEKVRYTEAGLRNQINNEKIRSLVYLKLMFLDDVMESLINSITDSIIQFFYDTERNIIIAFICFVIVMIVGVIITTTWGMDFLYKHFNATKSILNLIPGKCLLELSEKTDLKKIQF